MKADIHLPEPVQRLLALALLILPLGVIVALGYGQVAAYWQHQERVALLTREVKTLETLSQGVPVWQAELAKLKASGIAQGLLFGGPNANSASTDLQHQVSGIVAGAGGSVTRNLINASDTLAKDRDKISVSVSFTAEAPQLVRILHGLEVARPLIRVTRLAIRNPDGEAAITTPLTTPNKLQVELVITSYRVMS